ncbi:hypothetical protein QBC35DRAFT_480227 [Podospora australis]|uniref:rRNA-processing protein FYV7 n=1 Tax=Podospora australis TaxID=1536484 RepID=A0AAN6X6H8_9PEZI|nr:hypothetical protein QBC35DRAFT_480227 [Podospora australis]
MAPKRTREEDTGGADSASSPKKARGGFRVGPENLPDGAWKRKVTKIKKDLITKAKVKKEYAKIKAKTAPGPSSLPIPPPSPTSTSAPLPPPATDPSSSSSAPQDPSSQPPPESAQENLHPSRLALLTTNTPHLDLSNPNLLAEGHPSTLPPPKRNNGNRKRKPDYFSKELDLAEKKKKAAEAREAEFKRREEERQKRISDREKFRRQMAKAKTPGHRDGKVKVGRESKLLLERVQRMVGGGN